MYKRLLLVSCFSLSLIACNSGSSNTVMGKQSLHQITNPEINPKYDGVVSANGPEVEEAELARTQLEHSLTSGNDTYTYVRCYYGIGFNPNSDLGVVKPATDYIWARTADNKSYFKLPGYWHQDGLFNFKNMFFSEHSLVEIKAICDSTVKRQVSSAQTSFDQVAANNRFSYNHTIWQNDTKLALNNHTINKLIAFGDSLSDTNNMYNASQWTLPNKQSWFQGRFSNGRNWVEYLAESLNLPLYNWALGGAAGDRQYLALSGLKQEVQSWVEYTDSAKNYQPERSLITVLIGANDFVNYNRNVDEVTDDVKQSLRILIDHHARHILILNLPDITLAPVFSMGKSKQGIKEKLQEYNQRLVQIVEDQRIYAKAKGINNLQIELFDTDKIFSKIIANPSAFGFTNSTAPCLNINSDSSFNYVNSFAPRSSCSNAEEFIFWDTLHITTKAHLILAKDVLTYYTNKMAIVAG